MTKQVILENILDIQLSQRQLEYIQDEWKAFYNDPLKYKGTIVPELIKHGIANM